MTEHLDVEKPSWTDDSIAARRGIGWSKQGEEHLLDEARQGEYHYTMGPFHASRLNVKPGDSVTVETHDAFEGAIKSVNDKPSDVLRMPFLNPQNGPIMVEGAQKGDVLAVHIQSIRPRGPQPRGTTCLVPEFGALVGTAATAMLHSPLPEIVRKCDVTEEGVRWSDKLILPYEPFLGTLGTAPEIEAISSLVPDNHGGNMDVPDVGVGAIVYLPVRAEGGHLFLGDAHACQGDGELCGIAMEHASTTTIRIDLIKDWAIAWPRLETETFIMAIGSARPMEDAARIAYRELISWMVADFGFDMLDAYMLLTQCGRARLGNMVDPKYSAGASILKRYLVA